MKYTSLPELVLCEETYNPKLDRYERKQENAGDPLRIYNNLKLLTRPSASDNTLRLRYEVDMLRQENLHLIEKNESLEVEIILIRQSLESLRVSSEEKIRIKLLEQQLYE